MKIIFICFEINLFVSIKKFISYIYVLSEIIIKIRQIFFGVTGKFE